MHIIIIIHSVKYKYHEDDDIIYINKHTYIKTSYYVQRLPHSIMIFCSQSQQNVNTSLFFHSLIHNKVVDC